jgi:hypothetical protein
MTTLLGSTSQTFVLGADAREWKEMGSESLEHGTCSYGNATAQKEAMASCHWVKYRGLR